MAAAPLASFTPQVRDWFARSFERPTAAQEKAWPAIAAGRNVLVSAPTGSGKTLAAFLWGLDRLVAEPVDPRRTRLVYVSPLKALSYDVEKNLRAPLKGIGGDVSVAIRTGDTPQRERQAMLRNPPDVLITTPESLYLMLTSRAREFLVDVEAVIVDEIHAVARTKRGAHMALTLERLEHLAGRPLQRIGLSATQRPLEEVGRFLVGAGRDCQIVDAGIRKPLDLKIHVPVENMREPDAGPSELGHLAGGEATQRSIWPAIYPELLELVREHRSTIIFVNNRRGAERLAVRLNELAGEDGEPAHVARAHHGSLAREERLVVEDLLKSGELPCIVATSSLELGIDMGAVDLVIQVESPKSVTAGLQRIGRAGHGVGEVSRGRIFPKFRADLLECAVVVKRMRDGDIEPTVVPRNPLDVLSQQVVAMVAAGDDWRVPELHDLVRHAYPFAELSRELLDSVLDMLDGRYPSEEFAELRPRIVWDRVEDTIRARRGARQLAVTNAGTIPDRGLYGVHLPDGRRVGELDEEMVYEARPGQTFLLGASTWRIEEITRDRVIVTPAPGAPGAVPFWKGEGIGRPKELGEAIGAFAREAVDRDPLELAAEYDLDERAARNLSTFLREQRDATRVVPSDRTVVVERFRDEIGDWRLCVLSPFGGRVHAAWALALSARIRDDFGLESDAIWSDDGIIVHLPDADEPPSSELVMVEPDALEELVVRELSGSALFGARFRENAARALLLPRAYPGRRTPLWQQRLKAQSLLEVAKRYGQFPIVLETYRECLRDVLDLPGLQELLRGLHTRELSLVEAETQRASPFASSLLFDYVATYMYEGDTPNAERRAAALALDRDLLRELLGQEELRDLIDPAALDEVEADLQRLSDRTRAANSDGLHDVLRAVGDLTEDEAQARCLEAVSARRMLGELEKQRRAVRMRIGGEERWIASEDAGVYRDALGAVPPGGLPDAFLEEVEEPLARLTRRYRAHPRALHHGRRRRTLRSGCRSRASRARGERPVDSRRAAPRWQRARVVRRGRAAAPAAGVARVPASRGGACRAARSGAVPAGVAGRGLRSRLGRRCGPAARADRAAPGAGARPAGLGARRAPSPRGQLLARLARPALCRWRARLGRARARSAGARAGSRCTSATMPAGSARRATRGSRPPSRCMRPSALASPGAPRSGPICSPTCRRRSPSSSRRRSGTSSGPARSRTTRSLRCARRGSRWPPASATAAGASPEGAGRQRRRCRAAGRSRHDCSRMPPTMARGCVRSPRCSSSATASSRARRCSPRGCPAGSPRSTGSWPTSRRSAPRAGATSWRGWAAPSSRFPRRSSGCAAYAPTSRPEHACSPLPIRPTRTVPPCPGRAATTTPPAAPHASRVPTWSRSTRSLCCTWSVVARASCPYASPRNPGCARPSRRWPKRSAAATWPGSASSASTASPWWGPPPAPF